MPLLWRDRHPCVYDRTPITSFDRHYVLHTAWAARVLSASRPNYHVDLGSDLRFVTIVSAFVPIRFYDLRPASVTLIGLECGRANLTSLPFASGSIQSLSCMHVVEHVGLGRYGDALNPLGDQIAIEEIKRVLSPGGQLLFVVPIGRRRIAYNAHRIYNVKDILDLFSGLQLKEFTLIPDDADAGDLIKNASPSVADLQNYGCGCFWFTKR